MATAMMNQHEYLNDSASAEYYDVKERTRALVHGLGGSIAWATGSIAWASGFRLFLHVYSLSISPDGSITKHLLPTSHSA